MLDGSEDEIEITVEPSWLDKMDGFLRWKIIGPDMNNPYAPFVSDRLLSEMANRPESLKKQLTLRCLVDGYEVLQVKNLQNPWLKTDHPCLTTLSRDDIFNYIERQGLDKKIDEEVHRIQSEIKQELKRREREEIQSAAQNTRKVQKPKTESDKGAKTKGSKREVQKPTDPANFRILRKGS